MSWILIFLLFFVLAAYGWQLSLLRARWRDIPVHHPPADFQPAIRISVLLPVRNEAPNIRLCLESLAAQNYPSHLLEIHLVDDHSSDDTVQLARKVPLDQLQIHVLPADQSGKKAALQYGAERAAGELLVCTDGDCTFDPNWLYLIASFYETHRPPMLGGSVMLAPADTTFTRFQALDYVGMMGLTAVGMETGALRLCNGAFLAYQRTAFEAVDGFAGINALPSGDDVLLLDKMEKRFPGEVRFLKASSGWVYSRPHAGFSAFWQQRIRWAGKTSRHPHRPTLMLSGLTFAVSLAVPASLFLLPTFSIFPFLLLFLGKSLIDYTYLYEMTGFYDRRRLLRDFFAAQCLHLVYWISVGGASLLIRRGEWKDRKIAVK